MDLNIQYRKASKYIATVELEFKGEELDYVKLLMKDAFLAGINQGQSLPIDSVSQRSEHLPDEPLIKFERKSKILGAGDYMDPNIMTEEEQILQKSANKNMVQWNQKDFQKTHAKLYKTIIEAINEAIKFSHC
jgi:hypothetical protein